MPRSRPLLAVLCAALVGCSDWTAEEELPGETSDLDCATARDPDCDLLPHPECQTPPASHPTGLRAVGNAIEDNEGNRIVLRGVNRSGSEYGCVQGATSGSFFDGPATEETVRAMTAWNINAVRIPLNESCWLGINGAPANYSGEPYQNAIRNYVKLLHRYAIVPILDLHWSAAGDDLAKALVPLPNTDHSLDFWRDVATVFANDTGVILEPFNEPYPDNNRDSEAGWTCWRDGCELTNVRDGSGAPRPDYRAAGMQEIVDAIRESGSEHLLLLGGLQYSNALSRWLEYMPEDPLQNLGAAWHVYNFNSCSFLGCWQAAPAEVSASVPLVATEIGQNDCHSSFIEPLTDFLDELGVGYLAWTWNAYGECQPAGTDAQGRRTEGNPWGLVDQLSCPEPKSIYAESFMARLLSHAED